jgi:hypothetical protein
MDDQSVEQDQQSIQLQPPPTQFGGKMLGQGVYGCAFKPPLKCITLKRKPLGKDRDNQNRVGKITSVSDAVNEFDMSKKLAAIKDTKDYFVLIEEMCRPQPGKLQTDPDLPKCDAMKYVFLPTQAQLIMPFGGKPLATTPINPRNLDFFALGQHLLEAGTLLLEARLVHCDLHLMNVLLQSPKKSRFIDFGLAWCPDELTVSNVRQMYRQFNAKIGQEPPEVSYLNGKFVQGLESEAVLTQILKDKLPLQLIYKVFGLSQMEQISQLRKFLKSSRAILEENQTQFYKLYWNKYDAWGLGVMLLTLYGMLGMYPEFTNSQEYKKHNQRARKAIFSLCIMDPGLRATAAEALRTWAPESPILKRPLVQKILKEQDEEHAALWKVIHPGV